MRVGGTRLQLNNNNEKAKHKQNEYNNNKWFNTFIQHLFLNIKNAEKTGLLGSTQRQSKWAKRTHQL